MITKRIKARRELRQITRERIAHARSLLEYLLDPEAASEEKAYMVDYMLRAGLGDTSGERLLHAGYRNLISDTDQARKIEMMALANAAKRSPNPVDHWLISWREGEHPTPDQVDETVGMFLGHLGLATHPAIYVLHGDTDNRHAHIAVNRYDIAAGKMIEINHGFNKEAAHQAVALIVDHFGWQPEAKQRYLVEKGELVLSERVKEQRVTGQKTISEGAAAFEWRTGCKSAQHIAQEEAVPIILSAVSWSELHARLADRGMTYERVGTNGIKIGVGDETVKASSVNAKITLTRLEKELGSFVPRDAAVKVLSRQPKQDRLPEADRAHEYLAWLKKYRLSQKRKKKREALKRQREKKASSPHELARKALLEGKEPTPDIEVRRPPPSYEAFLFSKDEGDLAARYCKRKARDPVASFTGVNSSRIEYLPIGDFKPCYHGREVRYARTSDSPAVFIDRGDRVDVIANEETEAIVAALRLAAMKFDGKVSVKGAAAFRERVFEAAQRRGLGVFLVDDDFVRRRHAEHIGRYGSKAPPASVATAPVHSRPVDVRSKTTAVQKNEQPQKKYKIIEANPARSAVEDHGAALRSSGRSRTHADGITKRIHASAEADEPQNGAVVSRSKPPELVRSKGPRKQHDFILPPNRGRER